MDFLFAFENIISHKAEIMAALGGLGGVYMFVNIVNGKSYVGSTNNLARRFYEHYSGFCSNSVLQNAFAKYGKFNFSFIVLAIVPPIKWVLLFLEQLALDYIKPAYNILTLAGSCLGLIRGPQSSEHRRQLSEAQQSVDRTGANNPMHGKVSPRAQGVFVYSLDGNLVQSFSSLTQAASWLNVSRETVQNYIKSSKVFQGKYIVRNS